MPTISELLQQAAKLQLAGQLAEAARFYEQVIGLEPRHAQAWQQLGLIASYLGRHDVAFEYFRRAILLDGSQPSFHLNMGTCCRALGKLADTEASFKQVLRLDPDYPATRTHLCFTLFALGRKAEAERVLEQAFESRRTTAEDHCAVATLLISAGRLAEGWEEHEWRQQLPMYGEPRANLELKWDRSPLAGRTILIYSEQGLGDTLQLVRYVPLIREQGGKPALAVERALIPLLNEARLCELVPRDEAWPRCDVQLGMWSLPWAFRTTLETIPSTVPYLAASKELIIHWRQRLSSCNGLRVGISWHGNPAHNWNRFRSIPLAEFAPLARVPGVQLISLQKNVGHEELASVADRFEVLDFGPQFDANGAFMDTAAVMKNLDLVVSCDTATAHLAGALGVPVWLIASAMPDWRWMRDRSDTPWYPTMRLCRQTQLGDWADVFARMAAELSELAATIGNRAGTR